MADEDGELQDGEIDGDGDGEDGGGRRKLSGKVLVLAGAAALAVLGIGGGAAYWMGLFGGGETGDGQMEAVVEEVKPSVFYDMPEMLVNLNMADGSRSRFLKLQVALEMTDTDLFEAIEPQMPRIMDVFQVYLRELRIEDLEGSAGVYRLKEELLRRVNLILSPQRIDRILFREMLIQ